MIFRPRVAPLWVNASAASGTVTAAARNAGVATASPPLNVRASHGAAAYATTANGTETTAANEAAAARDLVATDEDGHQSHVGDVHAEPGGGRGDEGELGGERDDAVRAIAQAPGHDHLRGERRHRADRETEHVLPGVAEDHALIRPARADGDGLVRLRGLDGFLDDLGIHDRPSIADPASADRQERVENSTTGCLP